MPTNPTTPNSNAAIGRLALGVDSPRGAQPSIPQGQETAWFCFEAEASALPCMCGCACFEAEASGWQTGCFACGCFEVE